MTAAPRAPQGSLIANAVPGLSRAARVFLTVAFPVAVLGPPGSIALCPPMRHPAVAWTRRFPTPRMPKVSTASPAPVAGDPKIAWVRCDTHGLYAWCRRWKGAFRVVRVRRRRSHIGRPRGNDAAGQRGRQCGSNHCADARSVHDSGSLSTLCRVLCKRALQRNAIAAHRFSFLCKPHLWEVNAEVRQSR